MVEIISLLNSICSFTLSILTTNMFSTNHTFSGSSAPQALYFAKGRNAGGFKKIFKSMTRRGRVFASTDKNLEGHTTGTVTIRADYEKDALNFLKLLRKKVTGIQKCLASPLRFKVNAHDSTIAAAKDSIRSFARDHVDIYWIRYDKRTRIFSLAARSSKLQGFRATLMTKVYAHAPKTAPRTVAKSTTSVFGQLSRLDVVRERRNAASEAFIRRQRKEQTVSSGAVSASTSTDELDTIVRDFDAAVNAQQEEHGSEWARVAAAMTSPPTRRWQSELLVGSDWCDS